jgi:hypothetical protein
MAFSLFKSFLSTVTPFRVGQAVGLHKVLEDPTTGAPVGIQTTRGNGPDGIWTPIDVTAAQIAAPTAGMIADLNATYRLNVAPYSRYQSNGTTLVALGASELDQVPPDGLLGTMIVYSPLTVTQPDGVTVLGTLYVRSVPA